MPPRKKQKTIPAKSLVTDGPTYLLESEIPYESLGALGAGSYGTVDRIRKAGPPQSSDHFFARKTITLRYHKQTLPEVRQEAKIIRRLVHRHVVKVEATYRFGETFSIIVQPVADCTLRNFLDEVEGDVTHHGEVLKKIPGCFLRAIHHVHDSGIVHGDLSSSNVLVHGNNVLISDFGRAFEIAASNKRYVRKECNEDIFRLGHLFLEMAAVLFGVNVAELRSELEQGLATAKALEWIQHLWEI